MICGKCKKENDKDSLFCEFCGSKLEKESALKGEISTTSDKDLEGLKEKPLYRPLKVIYFIAFFIAIILSLFHGLIKNPIIEKVFYGKEIIINCDDYFAPSDKLNFRFINVANAGLLYKSNRTISVDNQLKKICSEKYYYLNLEFHFIQLLKLIGSLFLIIAFFELIKQLTYYIFLGKFYPHKSIQKIVKKFK